MSGSKKQSIKKVMVGGINPPPCPQGCDGMQTPPDTEKHNEEQIRWFCGASPPDPTHQYQTRCDWTERYRTRLSLDRTLAVGYLVGGRSRVPVRDRIEKTTTPRALSPRFHLIAPIAAICKIILKNKVRKLVYFKTSFLTSKPQRLLSHLPKTSQDLRTYPLD